MSDLVENPEDRFSYNEAHIRLSADILGTNCATPHEIPLNFYHSTIKCAVILFDFHLKLDRFPLPLGAWDGLRYFIVTLPEPSI